MRIILILIILQSSCVNSTKSLELDINQLQEAASLASIEYVITKTIAYHESKWFTRQKATFLAQSEATVTLGLNLDKVSSDDIIISGTTIQMNLPPVEILNFSYDPAKFREIEKYTVNTFWDKITIAEKDEAYRQGESDIRNILPDLRLTENVQANTRKLMRPFLRKMGFKNIFITFKPNPKIDP